MFAPIPNDIDWPMDPLPTPRHQFHYDCLGLLRAVRQAMEPDPACAYHGYVPYYGVPVERAVWYAKYCMREARRIGWYPTTAQLEAEYQAQQRKTRAA